MTDIVLSGAFLLVLCIVVLVCRGPGQPGSRPWLAERCKSMSELCLWISTRGQPCPLSCLHISSIVRSLWELDGLFFSHAFQRVEHRFVLFTKEFFFFLLCITVAHRRSRVSLLLRPLWSWDHHVDVGRVRGSELSVGCYFFISLVSCASHRKHRGEVEDTLNGSIKFKSGAHSVTLHARTSWTERRSWELKLKSHCFTDT